jgi:hypothetical protein
MTSVGSIDDLHAWEAAADRTASRAVAPAGSDRRLLPRAMTPPRDARPQ